MKSTTRFLRGNRAFAAILLLMATGCATSVYKIDNKSGGQYELPVVQTNRIGDSDCKERLRKIKKILKDGRRIYISGIGDLEEPRKLRESSYFFPKHGTFMDNGRQLQFHAISNEHGECFDAYSGSKKPCPQGYFPLKKLSN